MKPIKLTLQAFGSYGSKCEIDFTKPTQNLFLITGDTGAGKTTIFDALVFALYGEASSNSNRKNGTELQSQFVDYDVLPFVEFVFSKIHGDTEDIYTLRRIPRHLRYLKRGRGYAEESESVSLILPDGSEYATSTKEIDAKIVDIIGLTKEQFMQVAMIAQGEFMELLRTKSDAKKLIFRKLFNTDIFQRIIDEFASRKKQSQSELATIKTIFRTESRSILFADTGETDTLSQALLEAKESVCSEDRLPAGDMDELLIKLDSYCAYLKGIKENLDNEYILLYKDWEGLNEAYIKAQATSTAYEQLDRAEEILSKCSQTDNEARERLAQSIFSSYEIKGEFLKLKEAQTAYNDTVSRLDDYKKTLSELNIIKKDAEHFADDKAFADKLIADVKEANAIRIRTRDIETELEKYRSEYEIARDKFQSKNNELVEKQTLYLDSRAGFIAKESLRHGEPCPVCGSLEHPKPCILSDEHKEITRDIIDSLRADADALRIEQETKAGKAEGTSALLEESYRSYNTAVSELSIALSKLLGKEHKDRDFAEIINITKNIKDDIDTRGEKINSQLQSIITASEYLFNLSSQLEEKYSGFDRISEKVKSAKDSIDTLIFESERTLPLDEEKIERLKSSYALILSDKKISENQWQNIVSEYTKADAEKLRAESVSHNQIKISAISSIETARATIGDSPRPEMGIMEKNLREAESKRDNAKIKLDNIKNIYENNVRIYNSLLPQMQARKEIIKKHKALDELYSLLSGNITGQRMDIETYVQRKYLEKILCYANIRFLKMSAGQYELRIYDINKAGEGKNRGLDLMVYSTVTGKEREVRTLSGGESFMAALSLSLGMADQISQNSSSLALDLMFIDEGFGSLDDHSRNQAIKVLKQMADSSKMIGIISHVSELKQEIDNQLIVRKTDHGSKAFWQIS